MESKRPDPSAVGAQHAKLGVLTLAASGFGERGRLWCQHRRPLLLARTTYSAL